MSFSDLMSSGRGPGVIGMVLALIVLLGFGLLFMFATDEGNQGADQSIESVIARNATEIESYQNRIAEGEKRLATAPARLAADRALTSLNRDNKFLADQSTQLQQRISEAKEALAAAEQTFEDYKNHYRAHVRGKAKGEAMDELATRTGEVYKNVNIREVTAVGIQIRHDEGQKRIPFEDLPQEMVDYYQFDPNQKQAALAEEQESRGQHDAAVAVANAAAEQQMALQREKQAEENRRKMVEAIAAKTAQIELLKVEINGLENDLNRAASEAQAARAAGRMYISKSGNINSNIRTKTSRIATLLNEINQLKAGLQP